MKLKRISAIPMTLAMASAIYLIYYALINGTDKSLPEFLSQICISVTVTIDIIRMVIPLWGKLKNHVVIMKISLLVQLSITVIFLLIVNILKFSNPQATPEYFYISLNMMFLTYSVLYLLTKYKIIAEK